MAEDFVTVASYQFLPEAEVARMHLEAEGIQAFLVNAEVVNMDWFLSNAVGGIKLQVPQSLAERAASILQSQRALQEAHGDDEDEAVEGGGTRCLACGKYMFEEEDTCPACGWSYEGEQE